MSKSKKKPAKTVKMVDITTSLISAASQGNLGSMKKLVQSHGLSNCECGNGGYVPLFVAIKSGETEIAKFLLECGAKAGCGIDHISTPLHLASEQGYAELVQLLLEKNVPVDVRNDQNETPLHLAAKKGHVETVDLLLNKNASLTSKTNEGLPPLFLAAEGRHEEVVQILLKHACANVRTSARTTLLSRVLLCNRSVCDKVSNLFMEIVLEDEGHSKIVDELVDHGFILSHEYVDEDLLFVAVKENYIKLTDSILKSGTNLNDAKLDPVFLRTVVENGHVEILKLLLDSGFYANVKNEKGYTCLSYSLKCCQEDKSVKIIQLLLANGADIKAAPKLLHLAVSKGLFDVCKVLVQNHADVNALNSNNRTPLYLAVSKACHISASRNLVDGKEMKESTRNDIIKLLLNCINDLTINKHTYKAFHYAVSNGGKEIVSMFLDFGVDIDFRIKDSPLCLASSENRADIIEILCKNNAELNSCKRSSSPVGHAQYKSKPAALEMLLKFGASFDVWMVDGCNSKYYNDISDGSDNDGTNTCDEGCNCANTILKKHIIKMQAAGFGISERHLLLDYTALSAFQKDCKKELKKLKIAKVNARFSLHDILVNGRNPLYAKNKSLMGILNTFDFSDFPIYKNLITGNLEISQARLELLQSGQWALDILVKISSKLNGNKYSVLPVEILEEIVSYLSFKEVKCLVYCGKALKRQLSKQFFPL